MVSRSSTSIASWKTPYQKQFRKQVHTLLYVGYLNAIKDIRRHHKEEDITGFVVREMRKVLKERRFPWSSRYTVHENKPVEGENRTGRSRKKPDITVESVTRNGRPEYMVEAKRLDDNANKEAEYLGLEGIGCFIMEHYASEYPEAIMLGYIQLRDTTHWAERIQRAMEIDDSYNLRLSRTIEYIDIINEIPHELVSEHFRENSGLISIYHILLDCCPSTTS